MTVRLIKFGSAVVTYVKAKPTAQALIDKKPRIRCIYVTYYSAGLMGAQGQ